MDTSQPLQLLGGLSPRNFMVRHWQKKPLLVRQAIPAFAPPLDRRALFALAAKDGVQSRLVMAGTGPGSADWKLLEGPFARRALPPLNRPGWTLLVQGVDLHVDGVHDLLNAFRFVPTARMDDIMVSYASDGGGVGPHFDSYDVFLLQAHGRRRWRIGRQKDLSLQPDLPLKILRSFEPAQVFDLDPGDMLYLPPRYAHDGVAIGECMTYSVGFRAPLQSEIMSELMQRLAQDAADIAGGAIYRDAAQEAVESPGAIPPGLTDFSRSALERVLRDPVALERALGEHLTEPKPQVWFEAADGVPLEGPIRLDRRTKMMYDEKHVFINGESFLASGRDAQLMRRLADERSLDLHVLAKAGSGAKALLRDWCLAGWVHGS